jgi:valine--pyruvate aminotransferase
VHGIYLIIDNAYGLPFPGAVFVEASPVWADHIILTLSLSKLGLPGTRTGIVVGPPEITARLAAMTSVAGLANPNIGQQLVRPMLADGSLFTMAREVIRPFYESRSRVALAAMDEVFGDREGWSVHVSEGAFFLWLRLEGLSCTTLELYAQLKEKRVLVVPGEHFFFGLPDSLPWPHRHECLRLNYSGSPDILREALHVIADSIR